MTTIRGRGGTGRPQAAAVVNRPEGGHAFAADPALLVQIEELQAQQVAANAKLDRLIELLEGTLNVTIV